MWITLTREADTAAVQAALKALGLWTRRLADESGAAGLLVEPHSSEVDASDILAIPGVERVFSSASPHPRVDAQAGRPLELGPAMLGRGPVLMAGPCSVESREQIFAAAEMVAANGGKLLRGGAFKPRTSPYSFTGHGREALVWMREAADAHGLGVVTEVMSEAEAGPVAELADLVQVGTRNMQNFSLLQAIGATGRPVLLKRGMSARIEEWLLAGEHLLAAGAARVIFCERGIIGFDPRTRNLLDLAAVALLKHVHGQLVVVDPSHATGRRDLIPALSRAALAAGADALLIEAHPDAAQALSDGPQALDREGLRDVGRMFGEVAAAMDYARAEREKVTS